MNFREANYLDRLNSTSMSKGAVDGRLSTDYGSKDRAEV